MRRALAVLVLLVALPACSSVGGTGDRGYISGDGQITQLAPGERDEPIELTGTDLDGRAVDLGRLRGQVVVVNLWGSWCPPCRAEMPDLVEVAEDAGPGVTFLGINVRDRSVEDAQGFVRVYDVPFATVWDPDGEALLAFPVALVRSPPSTLVLDRRGRIAAAVIGPLPSALTLSELVAEVAAERSEDSEGSDG